MRLLDRCSAYREGSHRRAHHHAFPRPAPAEHLLVKRRQILPVPVKPEEILPIQPSLPGEKSRTLVGDATTIGHASKLYEVRVDYNGRNERFYEWVDVETGVVLKLVSQDRDWSIEYSRIRFSPQPDYYFEEPTGYRRWVPASATEERG